MYILVREIVGWVFVVVSLVLVRTALGYIQNRQVIEAALIVFLCGLFMRCGIALVRVATAARICKPPRSESTPTQESGSP